MRLREIDFLRGVAVLLVIANHAHIKNIFQRSGWMGVDLFFVLSGFLVSGLLFKEYQKFNNINGFQFLIRRGFKIYPLFYLTIGLAIFFEFLYKGHVPAYYRIISELFFLQSYIKGIIWVTWSLAIEEHFYFTLTIIVFLLISSQYILKDRFLFIGVITVLLLVLGLRVITFLQLPFRDQTHAFPTHLRMDSLLFGVAIAYVYYFKRERLQPITRQRWLFYATAFAFLSVGFVFNRQSFFLYTIGYSLIYIGFGLILILFLTDTSINKKLDRIFSAPIANGISKIGLYSYGIYLWHMMVTLYILPIFSNLRWMQYGGYTEFIVYVLLSILMGSLLSVFVEQNFLKIRDKYIPRR